MNNLMLQFKTFGKKIDLKKVIKRCCLIIGRPYFSEYSLKDLYTAANVGTYMK